MHQFVSNDNPQVRKLRTLRPTATLIIDNPFYVVVYLSPSHHGMTLFRFADGEDDLQLWIVATNTLD